MLIGNDGSRLGLIAEIFVDDHGEAWLGVPAPKEPSGYLVAPVSATTERGTKDIVTWLDKAEMTRSAAAATARPSEPEPLSPATSAEKASARRRGGTNLTEIEGLSPADATTLVSAGVRNIEALLEAGGSPAGRRALAKQTRIDAATLLEWVNRADLMRIHGVGAEYSDLLESSGVDTVRELSKRKPANLQARMAEINEELGLVRRAPSLGQVARWVAEAKQLPVAVTY
jgi:predicted flap endonuclease-1-like 5' DNA nuclease